MMVSLKNNLLNKITHVHILPVNHILILFHLVVAMPYYDDAVNLGT